MQAGTTPKKRTSLNGRAALKLMRLDGARRADQAASDARVTKASSSIAVALLLISSGASATECQSSPGHDGKWWSYRIVDSKRCWYQGRPGRSKDLLQWAKQSPPPVVTRPDPGDSPHPAPPVPPQQPTEIVDTTPKVVSTVSTPVPTSEALQMAARPPSLPEPPPLPAKPTKPSKWWMLLLIIPAIATGLAVVASQFQPARWTLFKNFRRRWTNWQARLAGHLDLIGETTSRSGHAARRGQSRSIRLRQARRGPSPRSPDPPQRLMIADLAPIDHDPHRLAVTVYHHEVEGRREGVILEGLRQRVRVVSLVEPHRQHTAIWADGTKDAGLLHSDIDAVAQRLLKIFFHLLGLYWFGVRERVGERSAVLLIEEHSTFRAGPRPYGVTDWSLLRPHSTAGRQRSIQFAIRR